jgi:hypothetical protein
MLGLLMQESVELTLVTCKLAARGLMSIYRYFVPAKQPLLLELKELQVKLQDLTQRVEKIT